MLPVKSDLKEFSRRRRLGFQQSPTLDKQARISCPAAKNWIFHPFYNRPQKAQNSIRLHLIHEKKISFH